MNYPGGTYIYTYKTTAQEFCEIIPKVKIQPFLELSCVVIYHSNFRSSSNCASRNSF
jgi:hypothetical protein